MNVKHQVAYVLSALLLAGGVAVSPELSARETPADSHRSGKIGGGWNDRKLKK
ncbi:MAG: hypothetical protein GDA56_24280 [Hormoscilla sp. GM7CHS1pb]|nr:hypothetical protein [Hormoscilla sp. GM7CHS1pb]